MLIKGVIVETEAYSQEDEACHGHNKKTQVTQFYSVSQEDFMFINHMGFTIV